MAKLTKQQRKAHAEAEAILAKERLSEDEREFVFRNWGRNKICVKSYAKAERSVNSHLGPA